MPLPLDNQSKHSIDDELFEQFYYQVQNNTDRNVFKIINFERELYSTFLKRKTHLEDYDLKFYLSLVTNTITMTNRDNYLKLLINIFNVLNIWFNFCVLNHIYPFIQLVHHYIVVKIYKSLLKAQAYLRRRKRALSNYYQSPNHRYELKFYRS